MLRDDFEGALAAGWSWVREDPTNWSVTDLPGTLRIILQPEGVNTGENNLFLRNGPAGKFEIATLVTFTPTTNFQLAGLLVYQDDSNYVQFGRAFANHAVRNGIYLDNIRSGEWVEPYYATATTSQSQAYPRLRGEGTMYCGYYSEDGGNWTLIGQPSNALNPGLVGLIAAQAYQAETAADFDYFTITTLP